MIKGLLFVLLWYPMQKVIAAKFLKTDKKQFYILSFAWLVVMFIPAAIVLSMYDLLFVEPSGAPYQQQQNTFRQPETPQYTPPVAQNNPPYPAISETEKRIADENATRSTNNTPQINPILLAQVEQQSTQKLPMSPQCKKGMKKLLYWYTVGFECLFPINHNAQVMNKEVCENQDIKNFMSSEMAQIQNKFAPMNAAERQLYCAGEKFNYWGSVNQTGETWQQIGQLDGGDKVYVANHTDDPVWKTPIKIARANNPDDYFIGFFDVQCPNVEFYAGAIFKNHQVFANSGQLDFNEKMNLRYTEQIVSNGLCHQ